MTMMRKLWGKNWFEDGRLFAESSSYLLAQHDANKGLRLIQYRNTNKNKYKIHTLQIHNKLMLKEAKPPNMAYKCVPQVRLPKWVVGGRCSGGSRGWYGWSVGKWG